MLNWNFLIEAMNASPVSGLAGLLVFLAIAVIGIYLFGKFYQISHGLSTWSAGFENGLHSVADSLEKSQPVNPLLLLTFEEATELAESFHCFICPVFTGWAVRDGLYYLSFSYAGTTMESQKNCALYVKNTVRKFYRRARCIDCQFVYIVSLTKTGLCIAIPGNSYGSKQLAPLIEKQQKLLLSK